MNIFEIKYGFKNICAWRKSKGVDDQCQHGGRPKSSCSKNLRQVGKQNTSDCFVCLKLSLLWLWFLIVGSIDRFSRGTAGRTVLENVADAKITAVVSSHCRVLVSFLYAQGLTGNNGRFDG
jgi:hypothetical protein